MMLICTDELGLLKKKAKHGETGDAGDDDGRVNISR